MQELIDVFRMTEISPEARAKIIRRLGVCINDKYSRNITELIVLELIKILTPDSEEIKELEELITNLKL